MVTLDGFLNFAIPVGIIVFFVGLLYSKLQNEIHTFINWIRGLFENAMEKTSDISSDARPHIIYD